MIRVLHVIDSLDLGGAQTVVVNLARFRDRNTIDMAVAPMHGRGVFAGAIEKEDVPVMFLSRSKFPPGYLWSLPKLLRCGRYDVVHFHLFGSNWIGKPLAAACGVRIRVNHDHCNDRMRTRSFLATAWDAATNRLSSHILAVSRSTREDIINREKLPESLVTFLANGVDTNYFAPPDETARRAARAELGLDGRKITVAGLGRFHPQKNWPLFLKVASRFPESQFVIAGTGPEDERLRHIVAKSNLVNVRLLGFRDTRTVLAAANVFLLTSDYEGTPMILLEAMSCGLPSVVSHVDGCADLLADQLGGATAKVGSEEDFVAKLAPYIASEALRSEQGASARRKVISSYDARTQTKAVEDLYQKLIAR